MEESKDLIGTSKMAQIDATTEIEFSFHPDKTFSDFDGNGDNNVNENFEGVKEVNCDKVVNENFEGTKDEIGNQVVNENFQGVKKENGNKVVNGNFEGVTEENVGNVVNEEGVKEENGNKVENEKFEGVKAENVDEVANENFNGTKEENVNKIVIDTAAPFESVKEAVSKFGGIVDWKERRKNIQFELEKAQKELPEFKQKSILAEKFKSETLTELQNTKKHLEDLKLSFEKDQTEEKQAQQDSELAQLRFNEIKQGINEIESIATKTQLEVAKDRHLSAIQELDLVKKEIESLKIEFEELVKERDVATKNAEVAVSECREIEKNVDELTLELITLKELIDSSHATHLEAEENKINASLAWQKEKSLLETELKQEEFKLEELNKELNEKIEIELKLEKASELLVSLRAEFLTLMEGKLNKETEDGNNKEETVKELEVVKRNLDKVKDEVNCIKVAAASLKIDLEREKRALDEVRERENSKSLSVSSLETELDKFKTELQLVHEREKQAKENSDLLSNELKEKSDESERAKSVIDIASEELKKLRAEIDEKRAEANTIETKLQAVLKEIEATKASEELAKSTINSLKENQENENENEKENSVTISIEEYNLLSKKAREAEDLANKKVLSAIDKINEAKQSESKTSQTLEETKKQIEERKASLKLAQEKAERAKEAKMEIEQELRIWRAEGEQRRKSNVDNQPRGLAEITSLEESVPAMSGAQVISGATRQPVSPRAYVARHEGLNKSESKVRRSFFPRIVMFLARKKVQTLK